MAVVLTRSEQVEALVNREQCAADWLLVFPLTCRLLFQLYRSSAGSGRVGGGAGQLLICMDGHFSSELLTAFGEDKAFSGVCCLTSPPERTHIDFIINFKRFTESLLY